MSSPYEPLNIGDIEDDDATVIDELVQPNANPPEPPADVMTTETTVRPPRRTRLITGRLNVIPGWQAVMILPPDFTRKFLRLSITSDDPLDIISVGEDAQSAFNGGVFTHDIPLELFDYNGPVWIYNPTENAVTVSWTAVGS